MDEMESIRNTLIEPDMACNPRREGKMLEGLAEDPVSNETQVAPEGAITPSKEVVNHVRKGTC